MTSRPELLYMHIVNSNTEYRLAALYAKGCEIACMRMQALPREGEGVGKVETDWVSQGVSLVREFVFQLLFLFQQVIICVWQL